MRFILPAILALSCLASLLPAQVRRAMPSYLIAKEGNTTSSYPFHYKQCHMQQIWEGKSLTKLSAAVILSFSYRRDGTGTIGSYPIKSLTLPKITFTLGYTSKTISTLSYKFADNATSNQTTVFSGKLVLPYQPSFPGVGPWNIAIKLTRPFIYKQSSGNLLMDVKNESPKFGYSGYWIDAAQRRSYATYWLRGMSGTMSDNRRYTFSVISRSQGVPGGTIHLGTRYMKTKTSGFFWVGLSETQWGALKLPFDLTVFGMPGNKLYTGMDAIAPLVVAQRGSYFDAKASFVVPNDPLFGGATMYVQSFMIDLKANKAGIVFTNMMKIELGGGAPFTRTLATSRLSSATGYSGSPTSPSGPVVLFSGGL